jgi:hypothetical protein
MKQRNPQILATSPLALVATTLVASCLLLSSNPAQAQVTISSVYPTGTIQFESTNALTFNASSAAGIPTANVSVVLTTTYIQNGTTFFRTLTTGNGGLSITGPATNLSVKAVLDSNTLYKAVISATDAASSTATTTVNFDTINGYTFEAEDYDYTSNSVTGLFIDNPQTNLYFHLGSTLGVDFNHSQGAGNAGTLYRPFNGGPSVANTPTTGCWTENTGDEPRAQFNGTGQADHDIGFTGGGDWMNYTRHYPPGTYNIFMRGASGNSTHVTDAGNFTVLGGTATLTTGVGGPFQFDVIGSTGWQNYTWNPVHDSAGNLATLTVPNDGSASTIRVTLDNANCNLGFYLLLPVTTIPVSTASVSNFVPNGADLFQSSNTLTFNIGAPDGVSPSDVSVVFGGTNLYGHGFSSNLTIANGLSITGPSTNLLVTIPLTTNTIYSVFVQAFDAHGVPTSASLTFDTVIPFYTWEAEDFDYNGGQFFDNPQTNAYTMLNGITNVDFHGGGGGTYLRTGLDTEACGDKLRPNSFDYVNTFDYDVGNNNGGNWANYTRTYSNGTYNIYVRASDGGGSGSSDSGSMSLVTAGLGTTSQTVVKLGNWGVFPTGGWQTYQYVPVKDTAGNLVQFTGNGTVQTLRMTIDNGNCNENFFMLSPVDPTVILKPFVDNFTPDGTAMFQPSNTVTFIAHSQPGTATGNIVLSLNGSIVPTASMTFSGTPSFRTVSAPVAVNTFYTAVVTITDANGSATVTNKFGTFLSTDYQLETEDYDYTSNGVSGLFVDNSSGLNAYQGLSPASGIDCFESDPNGANGSFVYRPSPTNGLALPCETGDVAGDLPRSQMSSGGGSGTDYNIQYFGPNSWANYTRHYPWGTYGVMARTAEGNNPTHQTLWVVTGGVGTTNQTLSARKGTFNIPLTGWASWTWSTMVDGNGNPARVVFPTNGTTTLRLGGVPNASEDEANVNFLLLVKMTPAPQLAAAVASGLNSISFPTEMGYNYQVQYKNNLSDPTWTSLGAVIAGDWTTHSVQDPSPISAHSTRFYRVQVQ